MSNVKIVKRIAEFAQNMVHHLKQDFAWLVKLAFAIFLTVFFINTFLFQSYRVIFSSMMPTLYENDLLFVGKWSYGYSRASFPSWITEFLPNMDRFLVFDTPKRGDVVIIRDKYNKNIYVKRVVAIPGDTVQIIDGQVVLNDRRVLQLSYPTADINTTASDTNENRLNLLSADMKLSDIRIEYLSDDVRYYIVDSKNSVLDNTAVFTVPEKFYFVLGDNRDNSLDSRIAEPKGLGMVDFRQIVGKVLWLRSSAWSITWYNVNIQ